MLEGARVPVVVDWIKALER